jgi:hypothetical protein
MHTVSSGGGLRAIDREARRIGVTRQAFIKLRMADTLMKYLTNLIV